MKGGEGAQRALGLRAPQLSSQDVAWSRSSRGGGAEEEEEEEEACVCGAASRCAGASPISTIPLLSAPRLSLSSYCSEGWEGVWVGHKVSPTAQKNVDLRPGFLLFYNR
uniref:USP domain-containing protein n=1 Tax=Caenorhabditis tropicalis TaxID=1561998 RepID=A0A1I7USH4_9PELO